MYNRENNLTTFASFSFSFFNLVLETFPPERRWKLHFAAYFCGSISFLYLSSVFYSSYKCIVDGGRRQEFVMQPQSTRSYKDSSI
ncbi:hypothetical protein RDI58_013261 [Solanum bulbocastanum]|uniref:Uncharacterized protein n=1 Tax=Solanum bulbocastanum TaxID=147425 RepID=A0AAN8YF26_SOLBU